MNKLAILIMVFVGSAAAADFSGIWNGKGGIEDPKYGSVPQTAQMTLLQAGNALQGTMRLNNAAPVPITSGTVSGNQVTLVMKIGAAVGTARLTQNGANLVGKLTSSSGAVLDIAFTKN